MTRDTDIIVIVGNAAAGVTAVLEADAISQSARACHPTLDLPHVVVAIDRCRMGLAEAVTRALMAPLDEPAEPRFHRDRTQPRSPKPRFRKGRG